MGNEHLNNLANELRTAREKSKITIDQIFIKTRIDRKYLNAIESGNFSIMPEVYIRAFVREYAKSVGLDPEEIIKKFDAAKFGKAYLNQELDAGQKRDSRKDKSFGSEVDSQNSESISHGTDNSSGSNKSFYYLIGAVSLLLTIFIIYKGFLICQMKRKSKL